MTDVVRRFDSYQLEPVRGYEMWRRKSETCSLWVALEGTGGVGMAKG